jgi:hypothetical protein
MLNMQARKPKAGSDLRADRANGKVWKLCDVCAQRAASRFNFALPFAAVRPPGGPCACAFYLQYNKNDVFFEWSANQLQNAAFAL